MIYKIYNESSSKINNPISEEEVFYNGLMEFTDSMNRISTDLIIESYELGLFLENNWFNESVVVNEGVGDFIGKIIEKIKKAIQTAINFIKEKIKAIKGAIFKDKLSKADDAKLQAQPAITLYSFNTGEADKVFRGLLSSNPENKFTNSDQKKNFIDGERSKSEFTVPEGDTPGRHMEHGYVSTKKVSPSRAGLKTEWDDLAKKYDEFVKVITVLGNETNTKLDAKLQDLLNDNPSSEITGNLSLYVSALTDLIGIYTQNVTKVVEHNKRVLERCVDSASKSSSDKK